MSPKLDLSPYHDNKPRLDDRLHDFHEEITLKWDFNCYDYDRYPQLLPIDKRYPAFFECMEQPQISPLPPQVAIPAYWRFDFMGPPTQSMSSFWQIINKSR